MFCGLFLDTVLLAFPCSFSTSKTMFVRTFLNRCLVFVSKAYLVPSSLCWDFCRTWAIFSFHSMPQASFHRLSRQKLVIQPSFGCPLGFQWRSSKKGHQISWPIGLNIETVWNCHIMSRKYSGKANTVPDSREDLSTTYMVNKTAGWYSTTWAPGFLGYGLCSTMTHIFQPFGRGICALLLAVILWIARDNSDMSEHKVGVVGEQIDRCPEMT